MKDCNEMISGLVALFIGCIFIAIMVRLFLTCIVPLGSGYLIPWLH